MEFADASDTVVVVPPPIVFKEPSEDTLLKMVQHNQVDELREVLLRQSDNKLVNRVKDWVSIANYFLIYLFAKTYPSVLLSKAGDGLLAIACWHGAVEIAKMLLGCGADIDATNSNGSTPLHRACYRNNARMAQVLLAFGARYDIKDKSGRTAAEVGDSTIKRLIQSHRIDQDVDKAQQLMALGQPVDDAGLCEEVAAMAAMERARRRQQQAVPIVLHGATNQRLNGTYEPVDEIHNEWPVYSLRGDRDLWMVLVGDEWLVQFTKDKGSEKKALIRMSCVPHCWPELRADGTNGIIEYHELLGIHVPVSAKPRIVVVTEAEAGGLRASKMFKLAEAADGMASSPLESDLPDILQVPEHSAPANRASFSSLVNHDPVEEVRRNVCLCTLWWRRSSMQLTAVTI